MFPGLMRVVIVVVLALVAVRPGAQAAGPSDASRWSTLTTTVFQQVPWDRRLGMALSPVALAQDGAGFLWVGTQNGLLRWDGNRYRRYRLDPVVPGSLPNNFITVLHADRRGRLWVGMVSGGLARYDSASDRFIALPRGPEGLSHASITSLSDDGDGGLWIGTGAGLNRLDFATGAIARGANEAAAANRLPTGAVTAVQQTSDGALWVGLRQGLLRRALGAQAFVPVALPQRGNEMPDVVALTEDSGQRLWVGTRAAGAYVLDITRPLEARPVRESGRDGDDADGFGSETVAAIVETRPGVVWLGTGGKGIVEMHVATGQTRRLRHDARVPVGLDDDEIYVMHRDRSGRVWVGSNVGLTRHDPHQVAMLTAHGGAARADGLSQPDVRSIAVAADGTVWLGLGTAGVDIIDPRRGRVGALRPGAPDGTGLANGRVLALAATAGGAVYVGTGQGLYRAGPRGEHLQAVTIPQRLSTEQVRALWLQDRVLWLGGFDGVWAIDLDAEGPRALLRHESSRFSDPRITAFAAGPQGSVWIGTRDGLYLFDLARDTVQRIEVDPTDPQGLANGFITCLLTDRQGRTWIGTSGGGVHLLERLDGDGKPRFRRFGLAQGLADEGINQVLEDGAGRLWVSTDDGLALLDVEHTKARALGAAAGVAIPTYWTNSGAVTADGELLFGGIGGLTIVRPALLSPPEAAPPPLHVTDLRVGGRPLPVPSNVDASGDAGSDDAPRGLSLAPGDHGLEVEFAVLDYGPPERVQYSYRLEGFDSHWIATEAQRRLASYTNLPPGQHALQMRAESLDGAWPPASFSLPVHVQPAWYQTWGFRLALALLAMAAVALLVQARTGYLRRRQRELQSQVAERTAALEERTRELQLSQARLEQIAYTDALTGLPNRRAFTDEFARALARSHRHGERLALLLIDLDHFKQVNDQHGHDAGDALLIETARRLRLAVRKGELVTRLGGDEFAVLLSASGSGPHLDRPSRGSTDRAAAQHVRDSDPSPDDELERVCERIVAAFAEPVVFAGAVLPATLSLGVAVHPTHGEDLDKLYKAADLALYEAKRAGRNTWRQHAAV